MPGNVLLLLEDRDTLAAFVRALDAFASVSIVDDAAAAAVSIATIQSCAGLVIGEHVGDRDVAALLAQLRCRFPDVPALVLTLGPSAETASEAYASNAGYVWGPLLTTIVCNFARRVVLHAQLAFPSLEHHLDALSRAKKLTTREAHILALAVKGCDEREELIETLGLTQNTVKTHVRRLLKKFGVRSVQSLVVSVLRDIHAHEPAPPALLTFTARRRDVLSPTEWAENAPRR